VGARDEKQVRENVKALDFKLSDDELKKIDIAVNAFSLV
jgi:aryl-alcohol dehydrogenase-like predicted oxidoreductase